PELPPIGYIFRWGCTSNVPVERIIVNTAKAIHLVSDKTAFRKLLNDAELCPQTWFADDAAVGLPYPVVVRPRVHAQGKQLYLCNDQHELQNAMRICGPGFYISEYIPKVAEYRVFVAQGRTVWVAQKTPGNP